MLRRIAIVLPLLVAGSLWAGVPQATAQYGSGCMLDGAAKFNTPLTNDAADFTFSFNGKLTNCQSNESGAPGSGTVSAGEIITIKGQKFQEPIPSGHGSCANGTTDGIAIATWSDKTISVVKYSTNSAAAAVELMGNVIPSVKLKAVNPKPGQPKSTTLKTTAYAGNGAVGALTFQPPDPTACSGSGVTTAKIQGFTGYGSA